MLIKNDIKIGGTSQAYNKPYFYTMVPRGIFYWLINP